VVVHFAKHVDYRRLAVSTDILADGGVDGVLFGFEFADADELGDGLVIKIEIGGDGAPPWIV
jgi:hypothetical protein